MSSGNAIINEIDSLHTLRGNSNVAQLLYCIICEDEATHVPSVYLAFRFFQSVPYKDYVQNITAIEFNAYMLQLFLALEFLHLKGILHRDIKPNNVLFDRYQLLLNVVDFGLAKRFLSHDNNIVAPRVGTFGYRAPEVLFGSRIQTAAMDVWSAGQICLNLLTGRSDWFYYKHDLPSREAMDAFNIAQLCSMLGTFEMRNAARALNMELRCIFPTNAPLYPLQGRPILAPSQLRNDASRFHTTVWKIVNRCWEPNPSKRSTASSIVSLLNNHVQGILEKNVVENFEYELEARLKDRKQSDLDQELEANVSHGLIQVISSANLPIPTLRGESRSCTVQSVVECKFTAPSGSNPWRFFTFSEQKTSRGDFVSPFQTRMEAEKLVSKSVSATGAIYI